MVLTGRRFWGSWRSWKRQVHYRVRKESTARRQECRIVQTMFVRDWFAPPGSHYADCHKRPATLWRCAKQQLSTQTSSRTEWQLYTSWWSPIKSTVSIIAIGSSGWWKGTLEYWRWRGLPMKLGFVSLLHCIHLLACVAIWTERTRLNARNSR
jgi:hypothetical protein